MRYSRDMNRVGEERGSALIMVMLVIAGITTIVFATQRIALVQFSQSVREEDNLTAYYAAKAGIEDGLARYHFDKNTQTGLDSIFRFDLTAGVAPDKLNSVPYEIPSNTPITADLNGEDFSPKHQYYDLAITYKTPRINVINDDNGSLNFPSDTTKSRIVKDESLVLTGFPSSTDVYFLRYAFKFDQGSCSAADLSQAKITLQQTVTTLNGSVSSQVLVEYSSSLPGLIYDSYFQGVNLPIQTGGALVSSIRIRTYYCNVQYAFATAKDISGLGVGNNAGPEFDGLTTEILSTGYYGGAKRTLVAAVDRQTGNLIGIFDYLLYSGGNISR